VLVAERVKGFEKLPGKAAEMFKHFLERFYNAWGLEARETIKPIEVRLVKDKDAGIYICFDYEMYGQKEWLHVKNSYTWY
jgi:hypothetical protein